MNKNLIFLIGLLLGWSLLAYGAEAAPEIKAQRVSYSSEAGGLYGYLCIPDADNPRPAVLYHHGGKGPIIGGPPRETCEALAEAGLVGFSPIRRQTFPMEGHLDDLFAAADYVKTLKAVDPNRVGMMGFSRGGLLTFQALAYSHEFNAAVVMAAAPGRGQLESILPEVRKITTPVLLMVASNDKTRVNHVTNMKNMKTALDGEGKVSELIIYPPYGSDGHKLFYQVRRSYFEDILDFFEQHI